MDIFLQTIGGVPRDEIISVTAEVMRRFLKLPENKKTERTGGYFTILDRQIKKRYFINEIGKCLPEMDEKCFWYCQEKTSRLLGKNLSNGHISAFQSRDRDHNEFGGAIIAPDDSKGSEAGRDLIGAISGIDEHSEEAILIVVWMIFRWITIEDAKKIIAISGNPLFNPLLNVCSNLFDCRH